MTAAHLVNKDDLNEYVASVKQEARLYAVAFNRPEPVIVDKWLNPTDFTALQKCVGLPPTKECGRTVGIAWDSVAFHCTMAGAAL